MTSIESLIKDIRIHKGIFYPEDSEKDYLRFVFRYCAIYIEKKSLSVPDNIGNMMHSYVLQDAEDTRSSYFCSNKPFQHYIPTLESAEKLVETDIAYELNHNTDYKPHLGED